MLAKRIVADTRVNIVVAAEDLVAHLTDMIA
jgi:hypothetical protein